MREDKRNAVMCNVKVPEDYDNTWVWGKSFDNMIDFLEFLTQSSVVLGTMESHEIFAKDSDTDLTMEDLKNICSTIKVRIQN